MHLFRNLIIFLTMELL